MLQVNIMFLFLGFRVLYDFFPTFFRPHKQIDAGLLANIRAASLETCMPAWFNSLRHCISRVQMECYEKNNHMWFSELDTLSTGARQTR